jgi:hypothetical protein
MGNSGLAGYFGKPRADGIKCCHNTALIPPEGSQSARRELTLESTQIMSPERKILREVYRTRQKAPPRHRGGPVRDNGLALLDDGSSDALRGHPLIPRVGAARSWAFQVRSPGRIFRHELCSRLIHAPITGFRGLRPRCFCAKADRDRACCQLHLRGLLRRVRSGGELLRRIRMGDQRLENVPLLARDIAGFNALDQTGALGFIKATVGHGRGDHRAQHEGGVAAFWQGTRWRQEPAQSRLCRAGLLRGEAAKRVWDGPRNERLAVAIVAIGL